MAAPSLHAQSYWDNNGSNAGFGTAGGTWADPTTNDATQGWSTSSAGTDTLSGATTTTSSTAVNFGTAANQLGTGTITVSGNVSANTITMVGSSSNITLSGGNITLNGGLTATNSANTTAITETISSNITLGAGQTWTVNNGGSAGTQNLQVSGNITGGAVGLTKSGNGTLTLSGAANSWNSTTRVNTGTLTLSGSLFTTGTIQTGYSTDGSVLNITGNLTRTGGNIRGFQIAGGNNLNGTVNVIGSGILNAGAGIFLGEEGAPGGHAVFNQSGGTVNSNGNVWMAGQTSSLNVSGGNFNTGDLSLGMGSPATSNSTLTVNGTGLITAVTLKFGEFSRNASAMTLNLGDGTAGGNISVNNITYGAGGSAGPTTINFNGATLTANGTFSLISQATTVVKAGGAIINVQPTRTFTISNNLTDGGGGGGLTKNGAGTLTLNGTNTYTGTTTINAGTLTLGAANVIGDSSVVTMTGGGFNLGTNAETLHSLQMSGGALSRGGAILTLNNASSITGGTVILSSQANSRINTTGLLALGTASMNYTASSVSDATNALVLGGDIAVNASTTFDFIDSGSNTGNPRINLNNGNRVFDVGSGANLNIGWDIWSSTASSGALTKNGTGTLTLNATNTYSGATIVNSGTLKVNGSLAAGSSLTVAANATLGGGGTINGNATVNGIIQPQNPSGPLKFESNLTLGSTAEIVLEATNATQYDRITTNGTFSKNGTLTLNFPSALNGAETFTFFSGPQVGAFSAVRIIGFYTGNLSNNGGGNWTTSIGSNSFSFSESGGTMSFAIVPIVSASINTLSLPSTLEGTASAAQFFTVNGTNLTADISATAPASFEVSTDNSTFGPTATLTQTGGNATGTVFVRLAASAAVGTPSGNITLSSAGATDQLVAVSGNVTAPPSNVPVVTAASFNGTVGAAFSANITATNGPNSFSASPPLPAGLILDPATGAITGTPAAAGNFPVLISATNGNGTGNATISFAIAKGMPTITTPPTASPIRVGQTLADSTLSGGSASVNGTFAFADLTLAPVAIGNQSVTFTPTDSANYDNATSEVVVVVNPPPTINATPESLSGFSTKENAASASQTVTVNGTDLEGAITATAPAGYEISTDGTTFLPSLQLTPNQSNAPVAPAATVIANDTASNYGTPASNTWGNGANAGTGFQAWLFDVVTNDAGTPPPAFYAGAFVGDPVTAEITNMPAPAFGLYANPGGTAASATVSRAFVEALAVGDSFSFQWATNWDSDVGNKGFNIFAGGQQIVNVNQAGFPGNITLNGELAIDGTTGYGSSPMTWTFTRNSETNLLVTSTARDGSSTIAFSTNITISAAPEGFSFYTSAMGQGDQRQPYFNNFQITSSGATSGGNLTDTTLYIRLAANGTPGTANGNLSFTSANATEKIVTLSGTVLELIEPGITPRTINGTVGTPLTASINASNSPTSHTATGTIPPGLSFNATTGVFAGTPTTAGNYPVEVTATNADGTSLPATLTFAIAKGTPNITTPPTASSIFSDQTLANSVLSGGVANTPGNFTFTNPSAPLSVGNSTYSVTFTPAAPSNWNSVTLNVTVQVILRTPPVVSSQTINGTVGTPLTASINGTFSPTSHTATGTIPPGLSFNATTGVFSGTPTTAGNYSVAVTATNSDGTGSGNLTFAIAKGTPAITTPPTASLIYTGQRLSASTLSGGVANTPGTFAFTNPTLLPSAGNATQSVTFTPSDTANWNSATLNVIVPVSQDPPGPPVVSNSTIVAVVGQNLTASLNATNGPTSYNATTALPPGLVLNATTGAITGEPLAAGNFTTAVTATNIKGTGSGNLSFAIGKGIPEIQTPPAARLYTDETLATAYVPLAGGLAEVGGVFEFVTPSQSFPNAGNSTQTVQVRFTPFDLANWNPTEFPATVAVDALPDYGSLVINANITQLFEGDEYSEARIRVRRPGPLTLNATVNLSELPSGQLQGDITGDLTFLNLPSQVVIPAGSNSTVFYVIAKNDSSYTGNRSVVLSVTSRFHGTAPQSVTLNIIEDDDASAAGFAAWSNNAPRTEALIRDYAIGGASLGQRGQLPVLGMNATHMSLDALVRTDDPKLTYHGEWTTDLRNGTWTPVLLQTPASPTGFGNLLFSIPRDNGETKKFLRLKVTLDE